jgi:hypothetical protein
MDIGGMTYEQAQLYRGAIFDLVKNPLGWKLPIDAVVPCNSVALANAITDAVIHFTGSTPQIEAVEGGLSVKAAGYYATIGA